MAQSRHFPILHRDGQSPWLWCDNPTVCTSEYEATSKTRREDSISRDREDPEFRRRPATSVNRESIRGSSLRRGAILVCRIAYADESLREFLRLLSDFADMSGAGRTPGMSHEGEGAGPTGVILSLRQIARKQPNDTGLNGLRLRPAELDIVFVACRSRGRIFLAWDTFYFFFHKIHGIVTQLRILYKSNLSERERAILFSETLAFAILFAFSFSIFGRVDDYEMEARIAIERGHSDIRRVEIKEKGERSVRVGR